MIQANTKRCPGCMEEIHAEAVKCKYCGRFQNWRRYLGLSSSFMSILVAFISVSTVFVTITINAAKKQDSVIDVSVINRQRTFFYDQRGFTQILLVEAFVTNAGRRPGALKSLAVKGNGDSEYHFMRHGEVVRGNEYDHEHIEAVTIEPGSSLLLKSYLKTSMNPEAFNKRFSDSVLRFEIVNFSGEEIIITKAFHHSPPEYYQ